MTNFPFTSFEQFRDVESLNWIAEARAKGVDDPTIMNSLRARSRDNSRTPMQWDDSRHAGFTTGDPWITVNPNHAKVNAAAAVADPESVFHHYRRLIEMRHTMPIVIDGDFQLLAPEDLNLFVYSRRLGDERLLVVANMSGSTVRFPVPDDFSGGELLVGNLSETLAPWQSYALYASAHG